MELTYYGANCLRIVTKKAQIVIDDNLTKLGLKSVTKPTDISLRTLETVPRPNSRFDTHMPGEYEITGAVIHGVAARAYMDRDDQRSATIYTIQADDVKVAVLGHIYPQLSEEQLEQIGHVDVAVIPIGNNGYTMDGIGALKLIKQIEPEVVIPTHYADRAIKYEMPQVELADGLKGLAMEASETLAKYRPKPVEFTDTTKLILLEKQ